MTRKSGSNGAWKSKVPLDFPASGLGQSCPQQCPKHEEPANASLDSPLGEPLTIREVAQIVGCSVWTVRHRLLRRGLPYVRLAGGARLIFYKNQVIEWILETQKEGR